MIEVIGLQKADGPPCPVPWGNPTQHENGVTIHELDPDTEYLVRCRRTETKEVFHVKGWPNAEGNLVVSVS